MYLQQVYTDTLNKSLGESGYREESGAKCVFCGVFNTAPFRYSGLISSPKKIYIGKRKKKIDPAERLREYIRKVYGDINGKKKKKKVEKKS